MRQLALAVTLLLVTAVFPKHIFAEVYHAPSAALTPQVKNLKQADDLRVAALERVFTKYDSPLTPYAKDYVAMADKHSVDWKLLPAISGLESTFGKQLINGTYNAYGWGSGTIYFKNWVDGIETIDKSLRENYMDKWKATDVWSIGPIYAESPTWSVRVNHFMNEINNEYLALAQAKTLTPNLQ